MVSVREQFCDGGAFAADSVHQSAEDRVLVEMVGHYGIDSVINLISGVLDEFK